MLVGNQIGANNVPLAKRIASLIYMEAMIFTFLIAVVLYVSREPLANLFTDTKQIDLNVEPAIAIIPIICIANLSDMTLYFS